MALFNFLKRKKEAEKTKKPLKNEDKAFLTKTKHQNVSKDEALELKKPFFSASSKDSNFSYAVVKEPHISEKSSLMAEKNEYVFKVMKNFNKSEIKKSVEGIYGVNVLSVKIIKILPKKRRLGKVEGFKKGYIKAVVKIKNGQKIEIL